MSLAPYPYQLTAVRGIYRELILNDRRSCLLVAPTGSGKCLGRGTPVMLANGTTRPVETIAPGDWLMGPRGPVRVKSTARGREEMFRVTPTKGDSYVVNRSHILSLRRNAGVNKGEVVNLSIDDYFASSPFFRHTAKGWRAPVSRFEGEAAELPIPPYILGLWLGDGDSRGPAITNVDSACLAAWRHYADRIGCTVRSNDSNGTRCPTHHLISRVSGAGCNPLRNALASLGLIQNKHIPAIYRTAGWDDRLELLAGLIDTDGYLSKGCYDLVFKQQAMAEGICFVARSLGLAAYWQPCRKGIKARAFEGTYYRVSISGDLAMIPCRVPRRQATPRACNKDVTNVGITVESIGEGDYFGFELEGPDRLFLLGDFTVTHNTTMASFLIQKLVELLQWDALFFAHRREIIHQSAAKLTDAGLWPGIIMAGDVYTPSRNVQVASIQSYLSWVKRGKIADNRPRIVVVDECFPGDVEILTERGWVRFDALTDERVAQYGDGVLSFAAPVERIQRPFDGELVRLVSDQTIDLAMTPGHEVILRGKDGRERKLAVEHAKLSGYHLPVAAPATGSERVLTPFERLMIAAQADGSMHGNSGAIAFSFSKERKINRFLALMHEGAFHFTEINDKPRNLPRRKERRRFIVRDLPASSKRVYEFFNLAEMGAGLARAILEEAIEWDGSRLPGCGLYYSSTDPACADFYQAVAVLAGYRARKTIQIDNRKASYKPVHRLFIQAGCDRISGRTVRKEHVAYRGDVHCVRVPLGNIVVRSHGNVTIVGNCHRSLSPTYRELLEAMMADGVKLLGITATPIGSNGAGLGDLYDCMVKCPGYAELAAMGFLVLPDYYVGIVPDLSGVKIVGDDYGQAELNEVMDQRLLIGDTLDNWARHSKGRPTIGFAAGVPHSMHLTELFCAHGVRAVHIDGTTDKEVRDQANKDLAEGRIDVLFNYGTHVEGTDIPPVSCIIDAGPTKSLMRYLQRGGRGSRTHLASGKTQFNYHDHSGNRQKHGALELPRDWKLCKGKDNLAMNEAAIAREVIEHVCPACGFLYKGTKCLNCNEPWVPKGEPMEFLPAVLAKMTNEELAREIAAKRQRQSDAAAAIEKRRFYLEAKGWCATLGKNPGFAFHAYEDKFKERPPRAWDSLPPLQYTGSTASYMQSRLIRAAKRKAKAALMGNRP